MQVKQYLFQSPYSSPVQYGRVDPASKEGANEAQKLLGATNETMKRAQSFQATQVQEVKPSVGSLSTFLDVVA